MTNGISFKGAWLLTDSWTKAKPRLGNVLKKHNCNIYSYGVDKPQNASLVWTSEIPGARHLEAKLLLCTGSDYPRTKLEKKITALAKALNHCKAYTPDELAEEIEKDPQILD